MATAWRSPNLGGKKNLSFDDDVDVKWHDFSDFIASNSFGSYRNGH